MTRFAMLPVGLAVACVLVGGCPQDVEPGPVEVERLQVVTPPVPLAVGGMFAPHVFGERQETAVVDDATGVGVASIDWTAGVMHVEGVGYEPARALSAAQRKIAAQRAARVVAVRNAARVAAWLAADPGQALGQVRLGGGPGRLAAIVRGFAEEGEPVAFTAPDGRVGYRQKIAVPLWGPGGLGPAMFIHYEQWTRWSRRDEARYVLAAGPAPAGSVLECIVIDARDLPLRPALWPELADQDGRIVYDCTTVAAGARPVQYARSEAGAVLLEYSSSATSRPASDELVVRRLVIKAAAVDGKLGSRIILADRDARLLAESPEYASLLREGRVIVLTNSAPAGPVK